MLKIYILIWIAFMDLFIQLPIITPFSLQLGASHEFAAFIVSIYSLTNLIGNVIGGILSDRYGRKRIVLMTLLILLPSMCLYLLINSAEQLLLLRGLHGLFAGVITPVLFAWLGDLEDIKELKHKASGSGIAIGVAAITGPMIGGIVSGNESYHSVYYIQLALFIIMAIIVMTEAKQNNSNRSVDHKKSDQVISIHFKHILKPPLVLAYIVAFSLMLANGALTYHLPITVENMNLSSKFTGILLTIYGLIAIMLFIKGIHKPSFKVLSRNMLFGQAVLIVCMIALQFTSTLIIAVITMTIYGVGFAMIFMSMNKMISLFTSHHNRGLANGILYAAFSIGSIVGALVSGVFTKFNLGFISIGCIIVLCLTILILIIMKEGQRYET